MDAIRRAEGTGCRGSFQGSRTGGEDHRELPERRVSLSKKMARKKADALLKEAGEEAAARGREEGERSAEEGVLERQALREAAGKRMEEAVKTVIRELI